MSGPSPFVHLQKQLTATLSPVLVHAVGLVTVESVFDAVVEEPATLDLKKSAVIDVLENMTTTVKGEAKVKAKKSYDLEVGKDMKMTAKSKLVAKADSAARISGGGKNINMKSGKVDIG